MQLEELEELDDEVFEPPVTTSTSTASTTTKYVKLAHFNDLQQSGEHKPFIERSPFATQTSRASLRRHKSHHSAVELNGSHLSIVDKTLLQNEDEPVYANMPRCNFSLVFNPNSHFL